jgi:hypothetical protein
MTISIRPATAHDIGFILDGYFKVNQNAPMGNDVVLDADRIRSDVITDNPKAYIDIAEVDGDRAGFIFYSMAYFASTGQVVWVTDIYIDPFARGTGVPRHFSKNIRDKFPQVRGLFGVTEKDNTRAQGYFCSQGAKIFDHFLFIGVKF